MHNYTIGKLASQTGINRVTIRYYERCGLLPKAERRSSGYRVYPENIVQRINFIKNAKSVGFTLKEIQELLRLQENRTNTSQLIKTITSKKLAIIREKIASLQEIATLLENLTTSCDGQLPVDKCPILKNLSVE